MTELNIQRGLSTELFPADLNGVVNPRLDKQEGCWYLCIDTAELFLCIRDENDQLTLKRINEVKTEVTVDPEIINALETEISSVKESLANYAKKTDLPSIEGLATEKFVTDAIAELDIPDTSGFITTEDLSDYALKSELSGLAEAEHAHEEYADKVHTHTEYAEAEHTHDEYLTEHQSLANYYNKEEVNGLIPSLDGYATEQYVTDAIANHEGLAKKEEVEEVKTKLETEVLPIVPTVQELKVEKANEIPFTDSTIVKNQVGGFVVGEDVKGLTIAKLFAKLLGLADEPGENPGEPEVPGDDATPEEILYYLTEKNASIYVYDESDQLVQEPFTEPVAWTASEASVRMDGVSTKYTIKDGDTTVEAGYQQATTYSDTYWLTVALPSEINNIKVKMYDPDVPGWVEPDNWHMIKAPEQTIPGYTIWTVPEEAMIDGGATYRFVINN